MDTDYVVVYGVADPLMEGHVFKRENLDGICKGPWRKQGFWVGTRPQRTWVYPTDETEVRQPWHDRPRPDGSGMRREATGAPMRMWVFRSRPNSDTELATAVLSRLP